MFEKCSEYNYLFKFDKRVSGVEKGNFQAVWDILTLTVQMRILLPPP